MQRERFRGAGTLGSYSDEGVENEMKLKKGVQN